MLPCRWRTILFSDFTKDVVSLWKASTVTWNIFATVKKMRSSVLEVQASFPLRDLISEYVFADGIWCIFCVAPCAHLKCNICSFYKNTSDLRTTLFCGLKFLLSFSLFRQLTIFVVSCLKCITNVRCTYSSCNIFGCF